MKKEELAVFIGNKIKEYRKNNKLTQQELGEKVGIGKSTIANYEKGYRSPKKDMIFALSETLGVSIDDFFPDTKNEPIDTNLTKLTNNYQKLNKEDKQKLVDYSDELVDERYLKLVRENAAADDGKLHNQRTEKSEKAKARFLKETGLIDENNL